MAKVGHRGARLDLTVKQGSTLGKFKCEIKGRHSAVSLIDCTLRASIRKEYDSVTEYPVTCEILDAANGQFAFGMLDTETAVIPYLGNPQLPENQYVWDLEIEFPDGFVYPVFRGQVRLYAEVTY